LHEVDQGEITDQADAEVVMSLSALMAYLLPDATSAGIK
jgi:hypothetical protein